MTDIYRELLEALSITPARVQELTAGLENQPPSSDEAWGAAAIVAHLADIERLMRGRIEEALTRESPYFRSVDQEQLARERNYHQQELQAALTDFATERAETLQRLMNLPLKGWERSGIHEQFGEVSVEAITELLVDHDAEHLAQLEALVKG
jgi:hypothetical protein